MNYRLLTKIGCRLIALYLFVVYMGLLPSSIIAFLDMQRSTGGDQGFSFIPSLSPMVFMVLLSILLWVYADKLSKLTVKENEAEDLMARPDYDRIQLVAFSFAGILVVSRALPEAINLITQVVWLMSQQLMNNSDRMYITYIARVIGQIVQVMLGLWLILGSKGIMNGIKSLRTAGVHGKDEKGIH